MALLLAGPPAVLSPAPLPLPVLAPSPLAMQLSPSIARTGASGGMRAAVRSGAAPRVRTPLQYARSGPTDLECPVAADAQAAEEAAPEAHDVHADTAQDVNPGTSGPIGNPCQIVDDS